MSISLARLKADFPEKLQCLFRPARYKILYGGRGGSKSWGIARALLLLGAERKLRIACGREIQRSITDSVHHLLESQIEQLGLTDRYRVRQDYIAGTNGTLITFHGLKANIGSVKSIEGIDIFWAEEAQSISKTNWDTLIPTIRKDGSEIWVSFNPELETDETYRRFVLRPPSGATVQKIGWRDNPWFNSVLMQELEDMRARSEDDFLHVWEGHTKQVLDGAVFANEMRAAIADNRFTRVPYDQAKPVETYWDLGRADCTSIWFAQYVGFEYRIIDFFEDQGHFITRYLKALRERPYLYRDHSLLLVRLERFRLAFQMVASELSRKSPGNAALVHAKALLDDAFSIEPDLPEDLKALVRKLDAESALRRERPARDRQD